MWWNRKKKKAPAEGFKPGAYKKAVPKESLKPKPLPRDGGNFVTGDGEERPLGYIGYDKDDPGLLINIFDDPLADPDSKPEIPEGWEIGIQEDQEEDTHRCGYHRMVLNIVGLLDRYLKRSQGPGIPERIASLYDDIDILLQAREKTRDKVLMESRTKGIWNYGYPGHKHSSAVLVPLVDGKKWQMIWAKGLPWSLVIGQAKMAESPSLAVLEGLKHLHRKIQEANDLVADQEMKAQAMRLGAFRKEADDGG